MRVARRDASAFRSHRHTVTTTYSHIPVWHAINPDEPYLSRCGRVIDPASEQEHHGTLIRCRASGCRQAFEAANE
jgi:hypothetical protein